MHLECFLKSFRSFDHFHCCVSASASIQGLAAVGGSDSSWEATPRELVAGGGGGGDNDQSETTYLSNCLLYNKNYSVALSLNSQREGAAGGSWRLCFNQMNKQEPGALLRGGPSSLTQASFASEATGLPPGTRWMRQLQRQFREDSQGLGTRRPQSESTGRGWTEHSLEPTFQSTQSRILLCLFCIMHIFTKMGAIEPTPQPTGRSLNYGN